MHEVRPVSIIAVGSQVPPNSSEKRYESILALTGNKSCRVLRFESRTPSDLAFAAAKRALKTDNCPTKGAAQ
ncbi:MAG: hypothetical protein WA705_16740 [Candidatus Ozemobacteraceae bacterium]